MTRGDKVTLAALFFLAVFILVVAVPDWSSPNDFNTGPADAGRFFLLVAVLPVVLAFAAAIAFVPAGYRKWIRYAWQTLAGLIALYAAWAVVWLVINSLARP